MRPARVVRDKNISIAVANYTKPCTSPQNCGDFIKNIILEFIIRVLIVCNQGNLVCAMYKIVFLISNLVVCFVPGHNRRHVWRGQINMFLFRPSIKRFVKRVYAERVEKIEFIRQITLNRMVCCVNDKYFIKIFRNVTVKQLRDYAFLVNYIRPHIKANVPMVVVDKKMPMYVCERVAGRHITDFDSEFVYENQQKILKQVHGIIRQLQRIKVDEMPNKERFMNSMQERTVEQPCKHPKQVLAHFDLNILNLLFDDELNICAVIDWDTLSIANNPTTDTTIFLKYWNRYKRKYGLDKISENK